MKNWKSKGLLAPALVVLVSSQFISCANLRGGHFTEMTAEAPEKLAPKAPYKSQFGEIKYADNKHVQKWMKYWQGRGRRHMERYMSRSTKYLPMMKQVLRDSGLPEDLIFVPLIESGFNSSAYSHASAVGYWQFIRATGKRYGLKINNLVDERRDPVLSTRAGAEYLKTLYNMFGDWYLALAAYNTGEARVNRAIFRLKSRDFWKMVQRRKLPRETRNYVPKFIAAMKIYKNPEKYGFTNISYKPELDYDTVKVSKSISLEKLAKAMGIDSKELKLLNPRYRTDFVPIYRGDYTVVRVPKGMEATATVAVPNSYMAKPKYYARDYFYHRIRRGDTLSGIAQKYRVRLSTLRRINRLSNRSILRIGRKIRIPEKSGRYLVKDSNTKTSKKRRSSSGGSYHIVRRGENLSVIAKKYRTTVSKLRRLNQLGRRALIRPGQKLRVRGESSRSVASRSEYHVVRRGENLTTIANKYRVSVSKLKRYNGLGRRSLIRVGQKLRIKPGGTIDKQVYVVRRGDTLTDIAKMYRVSLNDLAHVNNIVKRSKLFVGKRLVIPD